MEQRLFEFGICLFIPVFYRLLYIKLILIIFILWFFAAS